MGEAAAPEPGIPVGDLRGALRTICWGVAIGALCSFRFSAPGNGPAFDLMDLVAATVVVVGLRGLPFDRAPYDLVARRRLVVVLVGVAAAASVASLVPAAQGVMGLVAWAASLAWQVLLLAMLAQVFGHLHARPLARSWRRLTAWWLLLGACSVACGALVALTYHDAPSRPVGGGWHWTIEPNQPGPISIALLVATVVLGLAMFIASIAVVVVTVRTLRWMATATDEQPSRERRPSTPIDAAGPAGPRLGRDGDRLVYYVDPEP